MARERTESLCHVDGCLENTEKLKRVMVLSWHGEAKMNHSGMAIPLGSGAVMQTQPSHSFF